MPEYIPQYEPDRSDDDMVTGFIHCVEWLISDSDDVEGGVSDRDRFVEMSPSLITAVRNDVDNFRYMASPEDLELQSDSQKGHDFYLTREGHGAGFWDRGLGEAGDRLTKIAKSFGSFETYVGDDGLLYAFGRENEVDQTKAETA